MGTRSLTVMTDEHGKEIAVMYRQMDGYPDGHGLDLASFLAGFQVVNGLGMSKDKIANGMGCLAAQVVAHFKVGAGGFYLHAAGTRDCGEDYIYAITFEVWGESGKTIILHCATSEGEAIFSGTPEAWVEQYGQAEVSNHGS